MMLIASSRLCNPVTLTGFGTPCVPSLNAAISRVLDQLYAGSPLPLQPVSEKHLSKSERNAHICERYSLGETLETLAKEFNLSPQRIHEILLRWCSR